MAALGHEELVLKLFDGPIVDVGGTRFKPWDMLVDPLVVFTERCRTLGNRFPWYVPEGVRHGTNIWLFLLGLACSSCTCRGNNTELTSDFYRLQSCYWVFRSVCSRIACGRQ